MKFAIAFVLVLMASIAAGAPNLRERLRNLRSTTIAAGQGDCDLQCRQSYDPVCAQAAYGPPQTFGNGCAVNQYICQSLTRKKI